MKWDSELYNAKHGFVADYGKELLRYVPINKTQRILDLGCGTGAITVLLAKRCGYVLGIDASEEMIEKAQSQHPAISFHVADALNLHCNHEWDVVFSNAVFHWIPDHNQLLKEIAQSLAQSGKLICEFGAHGNIYTVEKAFADILRGMGYQYQSKFNFPTVDAFGRLLINNGFHIDEIYDFDRPTPLKDGESGLHFWAKQFFEAELKEFSEQQQNDILNDLQSEVKERLWNGSEWHIDYRRLRAIAHVP